jgi:hypothetical protein
MTPPDDNVQVGRTRQSFQAARIDAAALKTDPTGAILTASRQLVAQTGHVGDLMLVMGPPHSPKLFEKMMRFLESEATA